jgi:hypothetical protein
MLSRLVWLCAALTVFGQRPNKELDCGIKQLAFEYGTALLSDSVFHQKRNATASIFQALKLADCGKTLPNTVPVIDRANGAKTHRTPAFYCSPTGSDAAAGTQEAPFASLARAQRAARGAGVTGVTVYLEAGRYELTEPLILTPADSGTTYTSSDKGEVVISGGTKLKLDWTVHNASLGTWQTKVPAATSFRSLFVEDDLQIPARWPNGRHESLFPSGYACSQDDQDGCNSWGEDVSWKTDGKKMQLGEWAPSTQIVNRSSSTQLQMLTSICHFLHLGPNH